MTIDELLALVDDHAIYCCTNGYTNYSKARATLHVALTEALAFRPDWADFANGRECGRLEAVQPVVKESLSTQSAQPVPPHEVNRANPASHDFGCHANAFGPCTCKAVQPVREPKNVSQNFRSFFQWANSSGYDTAHTCNSDTGEWIVFNPMTEDLWKCWQAAHGIG
jgi:hypothetical protein